MKFFGYLLLLCVVVLLVERIPFGTIILLIIAYWIGKSMGKSGEKK